MSQKRVITKQGSHASPSSSASPSESTRHALYWTRKLAGLCVDCGAGLTDDDTGVRCVECRAAQVLRQIAYSRKPTVRKRTRRNERNLHQRRVEQGLCVDCGLKLHERGAHTRCAGCRRHRRLLHQQRMTAATELPATAARMPTLRAEIDDYIPFDEREQNFRVRVLRAVHWLTHDGGWADSVEIFIAAHVADGADSRERNGAQVVLGRLVKLGLVERLASKKRTYADYRITDAGRAEVSRYRSGDLVTRSRRAA